MQALLPWYDPRYSGDFFDSGWASQVDLVSALKEAAVVGAWASAHHWVTAADARADGSMLKAIQRMCCVLCWSIALPQLRHTRTSLLKKVEALSLGTDSMKVPSPYRRACVCRCASTAADAVALCCCWLCYCQPKPEWQWHTYQEVLRPLLIASANSAELKWARERMYDAETLAFALGDRANAVEACIVRYGGLADSAAAKVRRSHSPVASRLCARVACRSGHCGSATSSSSCSRADTPWRTRWRTTCALLASLCVTPRRVEAMSRRCLRWSRSAPQQCLLESLTRQCHSHPRLRALLRLRLLRLLMLLLRCRRVCSLRTATASRMADQGTTTLTTTMVSQSCRSLLRPLCSGGECGS
jgi:hypothetical protein